MEQEMVSFIESCKVATVCCIEEGRPYCFNCYYSFIEDGGLLVYKSSIGTRHESILQKNKVVAGTIIPEQIELSTIRGIQFEGMLLEDTFQLNLKASSSYYLRFPFAMAVPGKLYVIEIQQIKFTDNAKGFGYKQHWEK